MPPTKPQSADDLPPGDDDPSSIDQGGYWSMAVRPLQSLIFLLPLVVAYELGAGLLLGDISLSAHRQLEVFLRVFGITGLYLPGIALIALLLIWHFYRRDPWELKPTLYAGMTVESLLLAVPLVVLSMMLPFQSEAAAALLPRLAESTGGSLELSYQQALVLSAGAGIYEELVFRVIGIAIVHAVVVDLIGYDDFVGYAVALPLTAAAFAYFHFGPHNPFNATLAAFYVIAGIYFGTIYVLRGLGIAAASHVFYDAIVLVLLPNLVANS